MFEIFTKKYQINARFGILILLTILFASVLIFLHQVLLPFLLAIFLAYLLSPLIDRINQYRIKKWRIPRGMGIILVYLMIFGVLILSGSYLFPQFYVEVRGIVKTLPKALRQVEDNMIIPLEETVNTWITDIFPPPVIKNANSGNQPGEAAKNEKKTLEAGTNPEKPVLNGLPLGSEPPAVSVNPVYEILDQYTFVVEQQGEGRFEITPQKRISEEKGVRLSSFRFDRQLSNIYRQIRTGFEENFGALIDLGRHAVSSIVGSFFTLFLVLMITGFLLVDPKRISDFYLSLVPEKYRDSYRDWLRGLDQGLSGVVRGQVMICLVNGTLTGLGIAVLGVPYVFTLSAIAAVFSLIPIFGVLISSIPILLMALTISFSTAMLSLGWILFIHFIEGNFLNPKILGDSARIHPVLIVFALVVGEHFGGVLGALLAVPLFSLILNSFLFLKSKADSMEGGT